MKEEPNIDETIQKIEQMLEDKRRIMHYVHAGTLMDILALLKEQKQKTVQEDTPGHWVVLENCSNSGVYCSECNAKVFDYYPMKKKFSYFCPHCGTRMEGQVVR